MLTKGDIADIIWARLYEGRETPKTRSSVVSKARASLPKRTFISDWELKKLVKPGQKTVKIPSNAIVSPLSLDWLDYNGIEILRD